MEPKLNRETTVVKGVFNSRKMSWAMVAASLALLLGILFWPASAMREVMAMETQTVTLPDNSVMILNKQSVAKFQEQWSDEERVIELQGQAFFQVQKGQKFVVKTDNGRVEVLGTSFDVYARDKSFRILCHTGKVKVSSGNSDLTIEPGQSAALQSNGLVLGGFNQAQPDWRNGEFYFNNRPLTEVFEELARQFDVKINAPGINNRFFTGRFNNKNLNEALETVCLPMGLNYSITGNIIIVSTE